MAYQTGSIRYLGSFKSIRNYRNAHKKKTYAGEKGGANRNLIMKSLVFVRTRENMSEFKGCGLVVKAIRHGLYYLLPEHADSQFTGRLVALVKMINLRDEAGIKGKRAISFSLNRSILRTLTLHEKRKIDHQQRRSITTGHPASRGEATLTLNGLNPDTLHVPVNAQYYRVINNLSVISDYVYVENSRRYKPCNAIDAMYAIAYSDYTALNTPLTATVKAAFPTGTLLSETVTVLQCVGIEYYIKPGANEYISFKAGSMMVYDVF